MSEPVAWQWLNTAHFRKNVPAGAEVDVWRPLYAHPAPSVEWDRFHHVMHKHGLHPGRTDDDLIDLLDKALSEIKPDHREAMRMALEALRTAQPYVAHYCKESIVTPHNEAINELKRALGERDE